MNRARALLTAALWASLAVPAFAQVPVTETWDDFAIVSSTMGAYEGRLCAGGDRGDVGCPTYAPSLTTAGDVSVTGNLSASKFIGDGSGLTGLSTTSDRITSGTSSIIVSNSGHISFTTAGTERMVINAAGNVGIGTSSPQAPLHIGYQSAGRQVYVVGSNTNTGWYAMDITGAAHGVYINGGSYVYGRSLRIDEPGYGTVLTVGNGLGNRTFVGVGTAAPTANLQVSGSFTVSTSAQTTTPSLYVSATSGYVGVGTSAPGALLHIKSSGNSSLIMEGGRGSPDAPAGGMDLRNSGSGIAGVLAYTGRNSAAQGQLVFQTANGSGIADRMRITENGLVGIATTMPSQTLHVAGTALTTSWTGINFSSAANVTPTAPLEVSGTISATALVINGQTISGQGDRITSGTSNVTVNQNGNISFTTAGTQVMVISGSNVGIGTSSPSGSLHVVAPGTSKALVLRGNNSANIIEGQYANGGTNFYFDLNGYLTTARAYIGNVTNNLARTIIDNAGTNSSARLYMYDSAIPTPNIGVYLDASGTSYIRGGNVGIGTTAPGQTLDVSGTARIVSRTMIGGTGTPSATLQVSGSLMLAGSDSTTCNDAYIGILRRNPTTGRLQVCK